MSSPIARLGRSRSETDPRPTVLQVDDDATDAVIDALGSETARALFSALSTDPATPSELARQVGTSVQNVHYHLSNLESAGVVEPVGTAYSEKGNEMTIYGPAADPIVLTGTDDANREALERSIADWATALVGLALVSVAVQIGVDRLLPSSRPGLFEPASVGAADPGSPLWLALSIAEPGLLFFVGGVVVLAILGLSDRVSIAP
ncbi:MAG: ArsR/SmtB family transcription factor [Haloferacaceae archaeon]